MGLDDVSKAIGGLEAEVGYLSIGQTKLFKSHEELSKLMIEKIDTLHGDLNAIKQTNSRKAGAMGVITAIGTLGLIEGVRYLIKNSQ